MQLKMDRFKVINEAFNQKLSQLFSVNNVYDGCFHSEIELSVPFMSLKPMLLFLKTFQKISHLIN